MLRSASTLAERQPFSENRATETSKLWKARCCNAIPPLSVLGQSRNNGGNVRSKYREVLLARQCPEARRDLIRPQKILYIRSQSLPNIRDKGRVEPHAAVKAALHAIVPIGGVKSLRPIHHRANGLSGFAL